MNGSTAEYVDTTDSYYYNDTDNDTDSSLYPEEWIILTVTPPIVILGLIGNILAIIVYASKQFRSTNLAMYLILLAIVDSVILLLNGLINDWIGILFNWYDVRASSQAACKMLVYTLYASQMFGGWLISALNIERAIAVTFPLKAKTLITRLRTAMAIALLALVILLINLYIPIMYTTYRRGLRYCALPDKYIFGAFPSFHVMDMLLYSALPSIILIICNVVLITHLRRSRRRWKKCSTNRDGTPDVDSGTRRITIMCVVVATTYVVLTLPFTALLLYVSLKKNESLSNWPISYVVLYELNLVNSAINFLLYSISAPSFRRSLKTTLCRCPHIAEPVTQTTSLSDRRVSTDLEGDLDLPARGEDNGDRRTESTA